MEAIHVWGSSHAEKHVGLIHMWWNLCRGYSCVGAIHVWGLFMCEGYLHVHQGQALVNKTSATTVQDLLQHWTYAFIPSKSLTIFFHQLSHLDLSRVIQVRQVLLIGHFSLSETIPWMKRKKLLTLFALSSTFHRVHNVDAFVLLKSAKNLIYLNLISISTWSTLTNACLR